MFRPDKVANNGTQVLDGSTIQEWLGSVIEFNDGHGGYGLGWEPNFVAGYWVKSVRESLF